VGLHQSFGRGCGLRGNEGAATSCASSHRLVIMNAMQAPTTPHPKLLKSSAAPPDLSSSEITTSAAPLQAEMTEVIMRLRAFCSVSTRVLRAPSSVTLFIDELPAELTSLRPAGWMPMAKPDWTFHFSLTFQGLLPKSLDGSHQQHRQGRLTRARKTKEILAQGNETSAPTQPMVLPRLGRKSCGLPTCSISWVKR